MVIVILAVIITGLLATMAFQRITSSTTGGKDTVTKLEAAAAALDQFAGAHHRLPCPAEPTLDTGVESFANAATGQCTASAEKGTLPWKTLGLRREDGYDAWGLKLSYRVYTGNKGSLTQPEGVNMSECDITEPTAGNTDARGLCVSNAAPLLRSTSVEKFLKNKGLSLKENGVDRDYVAYVVMSHGPTGLGAYTVAGAMRTPNPAGDEQGNLRADGFVIKAFSGADVEATHAQHFDDLLVYRTIPDLVKKAGLEAHEWDDGGEVGSSLLNASTVGAALGQTSASPGDIGTDTLNLGAVTVGASGGNVLLSVTGSSNMNPDGTFSVAAVDGIGVAGNTFFGFFGDFLTNIGGEFLKFTFPSDSTKFAVTLRDFGIYAGAFVEKVELRFLNASGATVASVIKSGCRVDGGLASYEVTTSAFRSVEIRPQAATTSGGSSFVTTLLVSEVKACTSAAASCTTSLSSAGNACP
jgi:hypothetical protein